MLQSEIVNYEHPEDFEGLDGLALPRDMKEAVRQARIEARDIVSRLEPRHISSWPMLILTLRECLKKAEANAKALFGTEM